MSNNDKSVDTQLGWIYQGTKALVNREDYLLGKRLDKNFEMYSDAVVKEKPDQFDALVEAKGRFSPAASSSKVSALEVNIIKNEDPLVAIKVKEESLWREKMENPLLVLKMQKMLKKAMEKEERKKLKKAEKQRMREERRKERKENNGSTHTHSKHDVEREKRHSNSKHRDHSHRERHRRSDKKEVGNMHPSSKSLQSYDFASQSSSNAVVENDQEKRTKSMDHEGYGLVTVQKKPQSESGKAVVNPYASLSVKPSSETYKKPAKRKLTAEEMERRRNEMIQNAKWRDKKRTNCLLRANLQDEKEAEADLDKCSSVIRSLVKDSVSSMSVAQRISTRRHGLQKSFEYTEKKFNDRI